MRTEKLSDAAINAFAHAYRELVCFFPLKFTSFHNVLTCVYDQQRSGSTGCIPEGALNPVASLVDLEKQVSGVVKPDILLLKV